MSLTCPDCSSEKVAISDDGLCICLDCAEMWRATPTQIREAFCPNCGRAM